MNKMEAVNLVTEEFKKIYRLHPGPFTEDLKESYIKIFKNIIYIVNAIDINAFPAITPCDESRLMRGESLVFKPYYYSGSI